MSARQIAYLPLGELVAAERNPKEHEHRLIERSIAAHGFTAPVVLDERTGRLVAGHGRAQALRNLRDAGEPLPAGIRPDGDDWLVPVVRGWASKDDAHAEALLVADNQLTIRGGWNDDVLARMLADIADADPTATTLTGFNADEIADLLGAAGTGVGTVDPPLGDPGEDNLVLPADPITRPGQTWQLGPHRLTCGDCTNPDLWATLFDGTPQATCVWTDPPYGVNYVGKTARKLPVHNDAPDGAIPLFGDALETIRPHLTDGAAVYVAHPSNVTGMQFAQVLDQPPYRLLQQLVWVKDAFTLGRGDYHWQQEAVYYATHGSEPKWRGGDDATSVFEVPRPNVNKHHPTTKPTALIRPMLRNSTDPGDVVIEPFSGSGSTLMACHAEGRVFRGTELGPEYVDAACARYQAATGWLPVDVDTGEPVSFAELAAEMAGYKDGAAA